MVCIGQSQHWVWMGRKEPILLGKNGAIKIRFAKHNFQSLAQVWMGEEGVYHRLMFQGLVRASRPIAWFLGWHLDIVLWGKQAHLQKVKTFGYRDQFAPCSWNLKKICQTTVGTLQMDCKRRNWDSVLPKKNITSATDCREGLLMSRVFWYKPPLSGRANRWWSVISS